MPMETPLRGEDEPTDEIARAASEPQNAKAVSEAARNALKALADSGSRVLGLGGERFMVFGQRVLALGANPDVRDLAKILVDVKNLAFADILSEMRIQLSTTAGVEPNPPPDLSRRFRPQFFLATGFLAGGVLGGITSIHLNPDLSDSGSSNPQFIQVEIIERDGIPANPAFTIKEGGALSDQIDPDRFVAPGGADVVGIVLKNSDGTLYVVPDGAQDTVYAQVVNLVVSSEAETHPLVAQNPERYAAVLNARVVESSFPNMRRWEELIDNIQDTEAAYTVLTGMLRQWGGYAAVLMAVASENEAREERGEALITKPSELLRWISEDSDLPHSGAVALKIAEEASLIDHRAVAKDLRTVQERLEAGRGRVESIASTLTEEDLKTPLASLEPPPIHTAGLDALPRVLASSHDVPEAGVSSEQVRVWRETHPSRQENDAAMEANTRQWQTSLLGLSRVVVEEKGPLNKMARGRNRELLSGVLDKFSSYLDERIREPGIKTLEELREQSLDIKNYFFNECLSLLNRVHGHYSEYLRVFASKVMQQLADSYNVLLARQGVEGTRSDVHAAVLATLPSGFFKAS